MQLLIYGISVRYLWPDESLFFCFEFYVLSFVRIIMNSMCTRTIYYIQQCSGSSSTGKQTEVSLEELLSILRDIVQRVEEKWTEINSEIKKRGIVPKPQDLQAAILAAAERHVLSLHSFATMMQ